jgi:phosphoribosylformylglycinamidine synthase subunit PurS
MNTYTAHIQVMPLTELLDPQGKAVLGTLQVMQHKAISNVRIGRHIVLTIQAATEADAAAQAEQACKSLLYNPVMEQYSISITQ